MRWAPSIRAPSIRAPSVRGAAVAAGVAALLGLLTPAGCGAADPTVTVHAPESVDARSERQLDLDFEGRAASLGAIIPSATNVGTHEVRTSVSTAAGGRIRLEVGSEGGHALRFPAFNGEGDTPSSALLVHALGAEDFLSPRRRDFGFGADFWLDEESSGTLTDNGDNLIQRGLFEDLAQYKLQIDAGVPSCRVAGRRGEAFVRADGPVAREEWHRVECRREGDQVTMTLAVRTDGGWGPVRSWETTASLGGVRMPDRAVPLSIGSKVNTAGDIVTSSTDQFNGVIDNVHFTILGP